uniref:Uncharacterized protein n=1 Tax=Heterorhabditis bacteriophora TaxID=37862 RepID=A0A1I7WFZ8_HETBA
MAQHYAEASGLVVPSVLCSHQFKISAVSLFINRIMRCPACTHYDIQHSRGHNQGGGGDRTDRSPDIPFCTPDAPFTPFIYSCYTYITFHICFPYFLSRYAVSSLNIRLIINMIISFCNTI